MDANDLFAQFFGGMGGGMHGGGDGGADMGGLFGMMGGGRGGTHKGAARQAQQPKNTIVKRPVRVLARLVLTADSHFSQGSVLS